MLFSKEKVHRIFSHRHCKGNLHAQNWLSMDKKIQAAEQESTYNTDTSESGFHCKDSASKSHKNFHDNNILPIFRVNVK